MVKEAELVATYPHLWHMAMDGSWPSIQKYGLLSTSRLLDLYKIHGQERIQIESRRRTNSIPIEGPGLPGAIIRDQKPMSESALLKCLTDGITPTQWFETLNHKVFFWLSRDRLRRLLGARAYRDTPQTVITLQTASLVKAYGPSLLLSPINSGSTIMAPQPRGKNTFQTIEAYPFEAWRKKRPLKDAVAELTILGGVADIMSHVIAVHRVDADEVKRLWGKSKSWDNVE